MATTYYSDNYTLNQDGRTYAPKTPTNVRPGESVWVRAKVLIPGAGRANTDVVKLGPLAAGVRPVAGQITADAANAGLTCGLGYVSAPAAVASAQTWIASATSTALTVAQVAAAGVSANGDELLLSLSGTAGATDVTVTVLIQLANVGS